MNKKLNRFEDFFYNQEKEHLIDKWTHYFEIYDKHFKQFQGKSPVILEIGIAGGGSIDMWNYYFDDCTIYAVDINPDCKQFEKENVKIFIGDQGDHTFWETNFKDIYFDIVIDDGGHFMHQQIITYEHLYKFVKDPGVYLCEDTHTSYWKDWGGGTKDSFINYSKNFIDQLHAYHNKMDTSFRDSTFCVSYYDSVVVLEKKKNQPPISKIMYPTKKIIDCFIFYNETDLLKYRINLLKNVVTHFVIIESTHTFTGNPKSLHFNKELYKNENIIYIVVDDFPYIFPDAIKSETWKNEKFQRNCITRGLEQIKLKDNDVIIISDLDEIPDPDTLSIIKTSYFKGIYALEQDFYYYNLNCRVNYNWYFSKIMTYIDYTTSNQSIDDIRWSNLNYIKRGGWHLSYFGSPEFISNKIKNFSHQEYNHANFTNQSLIKSKIENKLDLFGRCLKIINGNSEYLPPKIKKDKIVIGFHTNQLCERGTTVSLYDYAYFTRKIKGNESIIFYQKDNPLNNKEIIKKFEKEFTCYAYSSFSEIENFILFEGITHFYNIKYGNNDNCLVKSCPNLVHAVFVLEPHADRYASICGYLSTKLNEHVPHVPHMINLPNVEGNLRTSLGIPEEAIVFGRYGGYNEFNIPFVQNVIKNVVTQFGIYFLFANTKPFFTHPRIFYLDTITDLEEKVKFIQTADAMIHAREEGEILSMSIGEFCTKGKPIITSVSKIDNGHISVLGEKAILYDSEESLTHILTNFKRSFVENCYSQFTPERVINTFYDVFIDPKITLVTAFFDIGRSDWNSYFKRDTDTYINSFLNFMDTDYHMVIFMDSRYIEIIPKMKNKILIPIDISFLHEHCSWKYLKVDRSIMDSEKYKKLVHNRIILGHGENISSEYNLINHSKIDFIKYAKDHSLIPDYACWVDFGYHNAICHNDPNNFPIHCLDSTKFNQTRSSFCIMSIPNEYDPFNILVSAPDIFTGSFYGIPGNCINTLHTFYHESLQELYNLGISDDDQHVWLHCFSKHPELFHLTLFDSWPNGLKYFENKWDRYSLIKKHIKGKKTIVEIGTNLGDLAEFILNNNKECTLYCIDPYISYNDYEDLQNETSNDDKYNTVKDRLKCFSDRVIFIRTFSHDALLEVPDAEFIYIDGNHKYKYVIEDLNDWYPKLKPGGVIIGDDAIDINLPRDSENNCNIKWNETYTKFGVYKAFEDFISLHNIKGELVGSQYCIFKV